MLGKNNVNIARFPTNNNQKTPSAPNPPPTGRRLPPDATTGEGVLQLRCPCLRHHRRGKAVHVLATPVKEDGQENRPNATAATGNGGQDQSRRRGRRPYRCSPFPLSLEWGEIVGKLMVGNLNAFIFFSNSFLTSKAKTTSFFHWKNKFSFLILYINNKKFKIY